MNNHKRTRVILYQTKKKNPLTNKYYYKEEHFIMMNDFTNFKNEIKKGIPFVIASKRIKYLQVNSFCGRTRRSMSTYASVLTGTDSCSLLDSGDYYCSGTFLFF